MSKKKTNLSEYRPLKLEGVSDFKVGIVTSDWNSDITYTLRDGCIDTLHHEGISEDNIISIQVPGTFELTSGTKMLIKRYPDIDCVIAIGCVIKGETSHNEYINNAVALGLTQLSLASNKPCIFGVLTPNSMEQAIDRAGGKYGNKGIEAAVTALKMIALKHSMKDTKSSIGF